jgi:hypothetical protein
VGTPKTCQAQVGLGGSCAVASELCGMGYLCSPGGTCVSVPSVGQPCDVSMPLCIGGYCDVLATTPTCVAHKNAGDSCSAFIPFQCASGLTCDAGTCALAYCPEP